MEEIVGLITTFFKVKVTIRRKELQSRRRGDSWRTPRSHAPGAGPRPLRSHLSLNTCPLLTCPLRTRPLRTCPPSGPGHCSAFPLPRSCTWIPPARTRTGGVSGPSRADASRLLPTARPPNQSRSRPLSRAAPQRRGPRPGLPVSLPCRPHPCLACAPTSPVTLGTAPEASRIKATSDRHAPHNDVSVNDDLVPDDAPPVARRH